MNASYYFVLYILCIQTLPSFRHFFGEEGNQIVKQVYCLKTKNFCFFARNYLTLAVVKIHSIS